MNLDSGRNDFCGGGGSRGDGDHVDDVHSDDSGGCDDCSHAMVGDSGGGCNHNGIGDDYGAERCSGDGRCGDGAHYDDGDHHNVFCDRRSGHHPRDDAVHDNYRADDPHGDGVHGCDDHA